MNYVLSQLKLTDKNALSVYERTDCVCAGWVSITAGQGMQVSLRAYTPGGLGCSVRSPALLKYAVNRRGRRIRGSAAFRTRRAVFCQED